MQSRVIAFVLAGGRGSRLLPLTQARAKPAVPFGGKYRIVDFALSNLINSGIYSIYVLTQYMSHSLLRHLRNGWQFGGLLKHQFIIPVAAQVRSPDDSGYKGTADAIFQNLNLIDDLDEQDPGGRAYTSTRGRGRRSKPRVFWVTGGMNFSGSPGLPNSAIKSRTRARRFSLELKS